MEEWSDEESGDIPFTTAPETKEATNNVEEEDEDEDDDDEEEGVYVRSSRCGGMFRLD